MKRYVVILIVLPALLLFTSCALAAPAPGGLPDLLHSITILVSKAEGTKKEMQEAYPSAKRIQHPSIDFGLHLSSSNSCNDMKEIDKLTTLYRQLKMFEFPVKLVCSSTKLAAPEKLRNYVSQTNGKLREATDTTAEYINKKQMLFPSVKPNNITETLMNSKTATYLKKFQVKITPDVVTEYRNYVIIYALHDAFEHGVRNCIPQQKRQQ